MKANRIMTLVLAAAVLAVVTSGMASAKTHALFYGIQATHDFGNYADKTQDVYGSLNILRYYYDLGWDTFRSNQGGASSTGSVAQYQSAVTLYSGVTVNLNPGQSVEGYTYGDINNVPGTYSITTRHVYQGNAPARSSPLNGQSMSFTVT